jgi:hypothetical protein
MPLDDWPRESTAQSTTWRSNSCTPDKAHAATHAVVPHRSHRCTRRCRRFDYESSEKKWWAHPWWSGWWSGW